AENREMAEAMGIDMTRVYARVFTLGTALGTVGGALVIPATAAVNEMGIDVIVEAFAVVVIGGRGGQARPVPGRGGGCGGEGGGGRHLAGGGDARDLRHRDRRPRLAAHGPLRAGDGVIVRTLAAAAAVALLLLPLAGVPYTTTLLLPAFGYAIALLGLNLLF